MALKTLLVLGMMLSSPSEPGNVILLGLSATRLVLAFGLFIAFVFFITLTIKSARDNVWAEEKLEGWFGRSRFSQVLAWLGGISFGLGWIGLFLPSYLTGWFENYWMRIQPVMVFILLTSYVTLALIYILRKKSAFINQSNPKIIRLSLVLFMTCLCYPAALAFVRENTFGMRQLFPSLVTNSLGQL